MARSVSFFVAGRPVSKGSKRLMHGKNGAYMMEDNGDLLKEWMRALKADMRQHRVGWVKQSPLMVRLAFVFPMRKSDTLPTWKATAPDADKLERAVLDAMTQSGLIVDDAQVVSLHSTKVHGLRQGCRVTIIDAPPVERPYVLDHQGMLRAVFEDYRAGRVTLDEALNEAESIVPDLTSVR